jgi:hypothetical protein
MTVQPGRKLTGLTFDEVEAEVMREHELVEKGYEFLDNLHHVKVYREGWELKDGTARDFDDDRGFTREDFRADDWVLHDTTQPAKTLDDLDEIDKILHDANKRLFSKDDIQTAVSFALGRFYYSNPDSHKIAGEVLKRLGFHS